MDAILPFDIMIWNMIDRHRFFKYLNKNSLKIGIYRYKIMIYSRHSTKMYI